MGQCANISTVAIGNKATRFCTSSVIFAAYLRYSRTVRCESALQPPIVIFQYGVPNSGDPAGATPVGKNAAERLTSILRRFRKNEYHD